MKWIREHALGIILSTLFVVFLAGQSLAGFRTYNDEQQAHRQSTVSFGSYLVSGDFIESVFENWESEFLQMASYVVLTVFLRQKGSAESKKLHGKEDVDARPKQSVSPHAPWPVRKGGMWLRLYEHSLSIALVALFLGSFCLHAYGGARAVSGENQVHGEAAVGVIEYVTTAPFWFESFQNWQSEYLAVVAVALLSVYLREKGSPESKPVSAPHAKTGR